MDSWSETERWVRKRVLRLDRSELGFVADNGQRDMIYDIIDFIYINHYQINLTHMYISIYIYLYSYIYIRVCVCVAMCL